MACSSAWVLPWPMPIHEIEVFRLNQGLVKASGEMSLTNNSVTKLAGVSRLCNC